MCLAVPGKVVEIFEEAGLKMGRIDYAGTVNTACLEYIPDIRVGQYTVVHAGFGLSIIDEEEAARSYAAWEELIATAAGQAGDRYNDQLRTIRSLKERTTNKEK